MEPLNLRDELDRLMPARTNFQYRFGTPADAAVQVKEEPVGHSMPVPEVEMANQAWMDRRESLSVSATDHGRGRCKPVRAPMPNHARAMARH